MRCAATPKQARLRGKHVETGSSFTLTRLGIWEDKRPLNSSVFSVGPLSAEAEWNWVTSVLIACSRSEYWGQEKEGLNGGRKTMVIIRSNRSRQQMQLLSNQSGESQKYNLTLPSKTTHMRIS